MLIIAQDGFRRAAAAAAGRRLCRLAGARVLLQRFSIG
jgi:hypothetical protein